MPKNTEKEVQWKRNEEKKNRKNLRKSRRRHSNVFSIKHFFFLFSIFIHRDFQALDDEYSIAENTFIKFIAIGAFFKRWFLIFTEEKQISKKYEEDDKKKVGPESKWQRGREKNILIMQKKVQPKCIRQGEITSYSGA